MKYRIADNLVSDILKLIKWILPNNNNCPNSLVQLTKLLVKDDDVSIYSACLKCNKFISDCKIKARMDKCKLCEENLIQFVSFSLHDQLRNILNKKYEYY